MALLNGLHQEGELTTYGHRGDVCRYCLEEKARADKIDIVKARNALKGELEGEKVLKFIVNGNEIVICKDHIKKITDEIFPKESEKAVISTKEDTKEKTEEEKTKKEDSDDKKPEEPKKQTSKKTTKNAKK